MNRKIVTLLLAAGALVGVSSVASAQLTGQPWNPMWDMVMRGNDTTIRHLPNRPAAPRPSDPTAAWLDSTRIRLYEGCAVQVDTAFIIPAGKNRRIVYKNMPKDHLGRHYIVNAVTDKVYTEFDTIKLPDDTAKTVLSMNFKHFKLSDGEPTLRDGYLGDILLQVKVGNKWTGSAYGGAIEKVDTLLYQYFNLPQITNRRKVDPSPRDTGRFAFKWSGALVNGANGDPYEHWSSWEDTSIHSGDSVFYVAPAYYSLDRGATWLPCESEGVDLNARDIADMGRDVPVLVRVPNGCGSYQVIEAQSQPNPPVVTREVTIENGDGGTVDPYKNKINSGSDFTFTVRPTGSNVPNVTTSRDKVISDARGVLWKKNADGSYTYTVRRVQENLTVKLSYTQSNTEVAGTRVWSENGQLYVTAAVSGRANVYNVLGKLNRSLTFSAGETKSVSVPAGIYVVSLNNGKAYKVAVR